MLTPAQRRLLLWLPLALALLGVLLWLFRPQPVAVDFGVVERGSMRVTVSDEGQTRVKDVFAVSAPVPGLMRRIELEPGDTVVAQSTVIARIEPTDPSFLDVRSQAEAQATVRAAEAARTYAAAEVQRATAELEFAQSELKRFRALAQRASISENDLDAAERRARIATAGLDEVKARLRVQEFELERARARLLAPGAARGKREKCDCVTVYSPVSGEVLRVLQESEAVVESGTPLIEIGDPQKLEVVVDLLSTDAVRVMPGQRVIIEAWGGEQPIEGAVRRVEPSGFTKISALGIEEQRVNVIVDFAGSPGEHARLGHGYRVEPRIVLWETAHALKVPLSALFRQGEQWAVFAEEGNRATLRIVELGQQTELEAQVIDGLKEGERVVLHPGDRVSAGSRLTERR
ncbi:MAG TPA: HlyD family efflux transporter periplasmic adaptor subunit [Steroidobacteraceae bacterium]|nr:HlyD family efflux transporter periplasmic adaptor subunit [Steroidobacteraceae bacterium]